MNFLLKSAAIALLGVAAFTGCGASEFPPDSFMPGVPGVDASISFEHQGTLTMAPGEVTEVVVRGTPSAPYEMTFFLSGTVLDASLNLQKTVADSNGVARVLLRAPNAATSFDFRATIKDGPSADLTVSVSDQGFGDLRVVPVYHGIRAIDTWRVAVFPGSCSTVDSKVSPPPAGALKTSGAPGTELLVENAPVGPNLAVVVSAEGYASGCSDEAGLVAGATTEVTVAISNKPIVVEEAELEVALEFSPDQYQWEMLMSAEFVAFKQAFFNMGQGEADTLLNAMAIVSSDPAGFSDAAVDNNWLSVVSQHLVSNSVDLNAALDQFAGVALNEAPPLLRGRFGTVDDSGEYGQFLWEGLGDNDADDLGGDTHYVMTLDVDPDDQVHLGMQLKLLPSRLVGAAVQRAGMLQYPSSNNAVDLLANVAQCPSLELNGFESCTGGCIEELCRNALQIMWSKANDASENNYGKAVLPVQVSAAAQLDAEARLIGFEGTWIGKLQAGNSLVDFGGLASGGVDEMDAMPMKAR